MSRNSPISVWSSPAPKPSKATASFCGPNSPSNARTAPLPLRAKVAVFDDGTVRLTTQTTIDRKDFGVEGNLMEMVVDKTTISGDVVFRQAAG
jgi:hypothetical protein